MTRTAGHAGAQPGAARAAGELPPTAAKLLAAARRILVRKGYASLTMQAIEQEAGINRALVHYYFGSKAGLLEALVESLFEDPAFGYSDAVASTPAGPARAAALLEWLGRITADRRSGRLLYELLPHVLRSTSAAQPGRRAVHRLSRVRRRLPVVRRPRRRRVARRPRRPQRRRRRGPRHPVGRGPARVRAGPRLRALAGGDHAYLHAMAGRPPGREGDRTMSHTPASCRTSSAATRPSVDGTT